jgi:hypothetical protein
MVMLHVKMSELLDSRCKVCTPHNYQCKACRSSDKKTISAARVAKKKLLSTLPPVNLFPSIGVAASPPLAPIVHRAPVVITPAVVAFTEVVFAPSTPLAPIVHGAPVIIAPVVAFTEVVFAPSPPMSPTTLEYNSDHFFPPMPAPAPLSVNGQILFPSSPKRVRCHDEFALTSEDNSGTDISDGSTDGDDDEEKATVDIKKQAVKGEKAVKMTRITKDERNLVSVWIQKRRKDDKMTNGRWIRNGGAKGQTMTATSGEVKTSGAYDALATYDTQHPSLHCLTCFADMSTRD